MADEIARRRNFVDHPRFFLRNPFGADLNRGNHRREEHQHHEQQKPCRAQNVPAGKRRVHPVCSTGFRTDVIQPPRRILDAVRLPNVRLQLVEFAHKNMRTADKNRVKPIGNQHIVRVAGNGFAETVLRHRHAQIAVRLPCLVKQPRAHQQAGLAAAQHLRGGFAASIRNIVQELPADGIRQRRVAAGCKDRLLALVINQRLRP